MEGRRDGRQWEGWEKEMEEESEMTLQVVLKKVMRRASPANFGSEVSSVKKMEISLVTLIAYLSLLPFLEIVCGVYMYVP